MRIHRPVIMKTALLVFAAGWVQAAAIEKPVAMSDAMVSITVSDLHGFIDGVGTMASQVSPMASGMMIKSMVGMQLGDPGLSGIAPGKGLAIVALDQTNMFAVIEVAEAQAPAYSAALLQSGVQSRYTDGVLVVAQSAAQLDQGAGKAAAVKSTLLARRSPSLQLVAKPAALIEKNNEAIDGMMQMMPMMLGMGMAQSPAMDPAALQSTVRIMEGEIRVLMSLAKQCDIAALALEPKAGSLQIHETFVPKPATRLATLLNSPRVTTPNPKVQAGMLGDAPLRIDCTLANPEALTTFLCEEIELMLKEMGIESEPMAQINAVLQKWTGLYNGSFSENIGFGGKEFMNISYVVDVGDEAETIALLKSMGQDMEPLQAFYKSLGVPMSIQFKENVREHNGVKIHQLRIDVSLQEESLAATDPVSMNLTNLVYDLAIHDGLLLYAMGDVTVETLIDRFKNPDFKAEPLKARSVYPADAIYYCDVDIAGYLTGLCSVMPADPGNPLPQVAALLQGADPVTAAGFREGGMLMWSVNIPGSLLAKTGQAVMAVQMQQMQQMQNMQQMPQPAPQIFEPPTAPGTMPSGMEDVPLP